MSLLHSLPLDRHLGEYKHSIYLKSPLIGYPQVQDDQYPCVNFFSSRLIVGPNQEYYDGMEDKNKENDQSPPNMTIQHQRVGKEHIRKRVRDRQENRKCTQN